MSDQSFSIPYGQTGYFSKIAQDYFADSDVIKEFTHGLPDLDSFEKQIESKGKEYSSTFRAVLVEQLRLQYEEIESCELTLRQIDLLSSSKTFTVTTGHQLNLFTGPSYFLYKIIGVLNACKKLKERYPEYEFIPIYWMATEDHDFDEIKFFHYRDKKMVWHHNASGGVGRLLLEGLEQVHAALSNVLGSGKQARALLRLFKNAYLKSSNLAHATRVLVHELFGQDGLVIIDGDCKGLKSLMLPYFKNELSIKACFNAVNETLANWPSDYHIQVTPREINLFYLVNGLRERIVLSPDGYEVLNTDLKFTKDEMKRELELHPERFSPNVLMRPLYQEVILPNLAYIGGAGEFAYWVELKNYFETQGVVYPQLIIRNSLLIASRKQASKLQKLGLSWEHLFLKPHELDEYIVKEQGEITIDFSSQKEYLRQQFSNLHDLAKLTDPSFKGAVAAQEKKQINGLQHLEKRLLRAQKRKMKEITQRAQYLRSELFPLNSLQERHQNFSVFYESYGSRLMERLFEEVDPFERQFKILVFDE